MSFYKQKTKTNKISSPPGYGETWTRTWVSHGPISHCSAATSLLLNRMWTGTILTLKTLVHAVLWETGHRFVIWNGLHLSLLWMSSFLLLMDGGLKSLLFFISKVEWGASTNVLSFWWSIMHESESLFSVCIISKILEENVAQLRSGLTSPTGFQSDSEDLLQEAVTCQQLS